MKDKEKKKTSVSRRGKGIVVRSPEKEQEVEILPFSDRSKQAEIYEEPEFDLDRIEEELTKIEEQRSFFERLLGTDKETEEIERLKKVSEKMRVRRELRDEINAVERQNERTKVDLLDMKEQLLEKRALTHPEVQKFKIELKLKDLKNDKLQKELKEAQLQKQINDLRNSTQKTEEPEEESYDLKDFEELKEKPTPEDDTS